MSQFKKGDKVVYVRMWNKSTAYMQECTVKSWGKKQGTLELVVDGKMLKERIYTTKLGTWFTVCRPEDAETVAMQFCVEKYEWEKAIKQNSLNNEMYNHATIQKELDELKARKPSVIWK